MAAKSGGEYDDVTRSCVDECEDFELCLLSAVQEDNLGLVRSLVTSAQVDLGLLWAALNNAVSEGHWACYRTLSLVYCKGDIKRSKKLGRFIAAVEREDYGEFVKTVGKGKNKMIGDLSQHERGALVFLLIGHEWPPEMLNNIMKENKVDVNLRYHCDMTPLIHATIVGNHRTMETILSLNPDLYTSDQKAKSAILYAIDKGCSTCLELILQRAENSICEIDQAVVKKATNLSVYRGQSECLSVLLNMNKKTDKECTFSAAYLSALLCETPPTDSGMRCVEVLLEHGADALWSNELGETVLMHAIIKDNFECFLHLLAHGIHDLDVVDTDGNSALMHAVQWARPKYVPRLLKLSADVNIVNSSSMTSISMACILNDTEILQCILSSHNVIVVGSSKSCDQPNVHLRIEPHSKAFGLAAQMFNMDALTLLMAHGIFRWSWLDHLPDISPEVLSQAAVKSSTRPGIFCRSSEPMTLLKLAFCYDSHSSVRFLMANLYLSQYDVSVLPRDIDLIEKVRTHGSTQCVALLRQLTSQPWSLQTLCFLSILSSIGNNTSNLLSDVPWNNYEKDAMIKSLPLPRKFLDKLMFRTPISSVCVDKWGSIGIDSASRDDILNDRCKWENLDYGYRGINLMSKDSPVWKEAVRLPLEPCAEWTCSDNNSDALRCRFRLLRHRSLFRKP